MPLNNVPRHLLNGAHEDAFALQLVLDHLPPAERDPTVVRKLIREYLFAPDPEPVESEIPSGPLHRAIVTTALPAPAEPPPVLIDITPPSHTIDELPAPDFSAEEE